jgi:hypothetical protein
MIVTAEKGIRVFQLDQKYFDLPSAMRWDVGKSGNWPAHPNTRFVMDGMKPWITLPGSNQGGKATNIQQKTRVLMSLHSSALPLLHVSPRTPRSSNAEGTFHPPPIFRYSASSRLSIASTMIVLRLSSSAFPRLHADTAR